MHEVEHTEAEWREQLTPQQYEVLRQGGTERAFTGEYVDNHADGTYVCGGCGLVLFRSDDKYDSGSGWPSFTRTATPLETHTDTALGMVRTELRCPRCGGHLGHVFKDGPQPTGERYCVNSASLVFKAAP